MTFSGQDKDHICHRICEIVLHQSVIDSPKNVLTKKIVGPPETFSRHAKDNRRFDDKRCHKIHFQYFPMNINPGILRRATVVPDTRCAIISKGIEGIFFKQEGGCSFISDYELSR